MHDPARVLREVKAKRRVLARHGRPRTAVGQPRRLPVRRRDLAVRRPARPRVNLRRSL
ncbi:DUF6221 family protein [Streptomyces niveus]